MFVECPHCQTLFRITSGQLTAAEARVRCGQCFVIFNALENLRVPDEEDLAAEGTEHAPATGAEHTTDTASTPSLELDAPQPARRRPASRWAWLAIVALALLLGGQVLWFERQRLYQEQPALRPLYDRLCRHFDCALPTLRDTGAIDLVDRQLYTHPNIPGALMIQATLVNNAPFAQPYPLVEITLSDEQGHPVALRRFRPEEYLARPEDAQDLMPPGAPVEIRLEVVDPGSKALAYEFRFL